MFGKLEDRTLYSCRCRRLVALTGALKMREWKMQEWKMREQIAGVENAGVENAGAIMRINPSEEIP